jgi:hypothetical protein
MTRLRYLAALALLPACSAGAQQGSPSAPSSTAPVPTTAPASMPASPAAAPVPAGFSPRSASFVSDRVGWVLGTTSDGGNGVVVATHDGGRTWTAAGTIPARVGADLDQSRHVSRIRFLSDTVGWAYGSVAYVTRDGGATWREAPMPGGRTMVSIAASGTRTYAVLGTKPSEHLVDDGAVWTGTVGADTFTRADEAGAVLPFEDVVVRGRTVLYEVGRDYPGTSYRVSNDAGATWATRTPCAAGEDLRDVTASTENDLVFVCDGRSTRTLRVSADGGRTVTLRLSEPRTGSGGEVAAATPAALTRVLETEQGNRDARLQWSGDGGRTFRDVQPVPGGVWLQARYVDATFGTVLRFDGQPSGVTSALYVTRDAGATWTALPVG